MITKTNKKMNKLINYNTPSALVPYRPSALKKCLSALLLISTFPALGASADVPWFNTIDENEYPKAEDILPYDYVQSNEDGTLVIEAGIEKNINLTLANCIELALGNNPDINIAFHDTLASDTRIRQAWSNYFPKFSWQSGYTKIKQLQLSDALGTNLTYNYWALGQITLQQMLYDFGVTQNQATIARLNYENSKQTLASTINNVIFETKDAYYNLLYSYQQQAVALDTVKKFELFYNQAKAFYEIGLNPKVDVTIAEANLSDAKLKLISAQNSVKLAVARLNNVMGIPYMEKYEPKDNLMFSNFDLTFEDLIDIARDARPELKQAEIQVETAKQTLKLMKKSFFPTITVEGQYVRGGRHPNSNYGYNYGAYLTFPTINGMLIKNEIKEARYLYDRQLAQAKKLQNDIYLEIQNAYLRLEEKKNSVPVALLQVKQTKENYELSYGRYKVGEASPIELKDAQNLYQTAQLNYYDALYQYNAARAEVERAIGKNINPDDKDIVNFNG